MPRTAHPQLAAWFVAAALLATATQGAELPDDPRDAFLAGAMTTWLEQGLGWMPGSYRLTVHNGLVTIHLPEGDSARRAALQRAVPPIDGIEGINIAHGDAQHPVSPARQQVYSFLGLVPDTIPFPTGDIFWPLLADPKQPEFSVSLRRYLVEGDYFTTASVVYGETFGLYRRAGERREDGLQISLAGGLFAQFDLGTPSFDLVNADYTIGFPVTYRKGDHSMRLRLYHQSSHLGDEFLLRVNPERVNLSFEALEFIYSYDFYRLRLYGGGEYMVHRDPSDLAPLSFHGGTEYRGRNILWNGGRWLAAVDIKSWEQHSWTPDISIAIGPEFGPPQPGRRRMRVMLEGYRGHNPHGQFYESRLSYAGLGIFLGF
ncbi:MAG TPA: DUF1207 domain-containing protein [Gammaproteobacteria bacterium]